MAYDAVQSGNKKNTLHLQFTTSYRGRLCVCYDMIWYVIWNM